MAICKAVTEDRARHGGRLNSVGASKNGSKFAVKREKALNYCVFYAWGGAQPYPSNSVAEHLDRD
jgi:hypothetical protein